MSYRIVIHESETWPDLSPYALIFCEDCEYTWGLAHAYDDNCMRNIPNGLRKAARTIQELGDL